MTIYPGGEFVCGSATGGKQKESEVCGSSCSGLKHRAAHIGCGTYFRSNRSMMMQRRATHGGILRQSCDPSFRSEEVQHTGRPVSHRTGPPRWCVAVLSVVGSAVAVAAVGCFCALLYPILRELRAERVRGQDGAEQRMLGFWSILVLSVIVGCICSVFSWTLTYLDYHAGRVFPTFTLVNLRDPSGFHLGCGVAVLNGILGLLTVVWSLS